METTQIPAGPRAWRNLRFQNQLFELNSCLEYTFFRINDLGGTGRYRTSLNLYAFVGGSVFYHNPKGAFLENANSPIKEWESLRPLKTEGQETPYSSISFSTPYGLGAIVKTATFYKFGIYFRYMKNYTDYLDDISTVYAHNAWRRQYSKSIQWARRTDCKFCYRDKSEEILKILTIFSC